MTDDELAAIAYDIQAELHDLGYDTKAVINTGNRYLVLPCHCHIVVCYENLYVVGSDKDSVHSESVAFFQMPWEHPRAIETLYEWLPRHLQLENKIVEAKNHVAELLTRLRESNF
jgi:hypothetical protein